MRECVKKWTGVRAFARCNRALLGFEPSSILRTLMHIESGHWRQDEIGAPRDHLLHHARGCCSVRCHLHHHGLNSTCAFVLGVPSLTSLIGSYEYPTLSMPKATPRNGSRPVHALCPLACAIVCRFIFVARLHLHLSN